MLWHSTPASRGLSPKPPAAGRRPTAHPARGRKRRVPGSQGQRADRQSRALQQRVCHPSPLLIRRRARAGHLTTPHSISRSQSPTSLRRLSSPRLRDQRRLLPRLFRRRSISKMSTATAPGVSFAKSGSGSRAVAPAIRSASFIGYAKQTPNLSGLRMSNKFRVSAAAVHKVKLISPDGEEHEFEAPEDTYILEAAENAGVELPFSCRAGSCSTCAGKMTTGEVDQSEGSFLDENQMGEGYLLTCISFPKADCVIQTHQEEELY
ncbi:ferredoxin-6, chloroplastic [Aegilops tauschii subsp. strangulata]|nr:ferredoxin-6, chloroplastic [Aegilops tauschii subsp. strangulata]